MVDKVWTSFVLRRVLINWLKMTSGERFNAIFTRNHALISLYQSLYQSLRELRLIDTVSGGLNKILQHSATAAFTFVKQKHIHTCVGRSTCFLTLPTIHVPSYSSKLFITTNPSFVDQNYLQDVFWCLDSGVSTDYLPHYMVH